ncbi:MAG: aldolase/citrate lyase family protein [Pseudomonadota bacterium]
MTQEFRKRLLEKNLLAGTILTLASPELSEILSTSGFDWIFLDLEHSALGVKDAQVLIQAGAGRVPYVVRVPANQEDWIKKCLDCGAAGIMVPQVKTAAEAGQAVSLCRYPPQGIRSVGIARAQGYGQSFGDYVARANDEVAVIIQIEHVDAVNRIDDILDVPGIDAVFVGPYDLSASMGRTGQVTDSEVVGAIGRVTDSALGRGITLGIFGADSGSVKPWIAAGYTLVATGIDTQIFSKAARLIATAVRS